MEDNNLGEKSNKFDIFKKRLINDKKFEDFFINILFVLSCVLFNYISIKTNNSIKRGFRYPVDKCLIASLIVAFVYAISSKSFYKEFLEKSLKVKVLSLFANIGMIYYYIPEFCRRTFKDNNNFILYIVIGICVTPFLLVMFSKIYSLLEKVFKKIYEKITDLEKKVMCITFILLVILMIFSFMKASVLFKSENRLFDVVYSSDSISLISRNAWIDIFNEENDLRQPLFPFFSAPFVAPIYGITAWFSGLSDLIVPITIGIANILWIIIITYLLSSLVENDKYRILFFILFITTYSPLLFSVMLEQYSSAVFWLILLIYMSINKIDGKDIAYVGATGTLLTSGAVFPLLFNKEDKLEKKIKDLFLAFICFVFVLLLFARLDIIMTSLKRVKFLMEFTGEKLTFIDKFIQYSHFIPNCFIGINGVFAADNTWKLAELHSINWIGIVILILCFISLIINKKDTMCKISFLWIIHSLLILLGLGWGTAENGLVLYTLYYSWAFIILIYQLLKRFFEKIKNEKIFVGLVSITSVLLFIINFSSIIKMVSSLSIL